MRYRVHHVTTYEYPTPVSQCYNVAHLLPRDTPSQRCISARLQVIPRPATSSSRIDYFGNRTRQFSIHEPHRRLQVSATSVVDVRPAAGSLDLRLGNTCGQVAQGLREDLRPETLLAREFVVDSPLIARTRGLADYARPSFTEDRPFLGAVRELARRIYRDFDYESGFSTVSTPLDDVLAHRRGVCQDFAHLAIGCLRSLGYPARYLSGYIETLPPDGTERLMGADASHAWFAAYSPGEGWHEFDPTNDLLVAEQHIATAWGRDFSDVTPLKGVIFGSTDDQQLSVSVDVQRLD